MTEYLISDELLTSIRRACYNAGKAGKEVFTVKAPSEEIVRCRDCEFGLDVVAHDYGVGFLWCDLMELPVALGHFCGWGKRREDA